MADPSIGERRRNIRRLDFQLFVLLFVAGPAVWALWQVHAAVGIAAAALAVAWCMGHAKAEAGRVRLSQGNRQLTRGSSGRSAARPAAEPQNR